MVNEDMTQMLQAKQDQFWSVSPERDTVTSCSVSVAACGPYSMKQQEKADAFRWG